MSQIEAIEKRLRDAAGEWVSMPDLVRVSGSYNIHSRAADLRRQGVTVENTMLEGDDGKKLSWYRIPQQLEQASLSLE